MFALRGQHCETLVALRVAHVCGGRAVTAGGRQQQQARETLRIGDSKRARDDGPQRMPHQHAALDAERVEPAAQHVRVVRGLGRGRRNRMGHAVSWRVPCQYATRRAQRFELLHP
jgi:hypothetical protein